MGDSVKADIVRIMLIRRFMRGTVIDVPQVGQLFALERETRVFDHTDRLFRKKELARLHVPVRLAMVPAITRASNRQPVATWARVFYRNAFSRPIPKAK